MSRRPFVRLNVSSTCLFAGDLPNCDSALHLTMSHLRFRAFHCSRRDMPNVTHQSPSRVGRCPKSFSSTVIVKALRPIIRSLSDFRWRRRLLSSPAICHRRAHLCPIATALEHGDQFFNKTHQFVLSCERRTPRVIKTSVALLGLAFALPS